MARNLTERERRVYKEHMKAIRQALEEGDEAKANRLAYELQEYLGVK